MDNYDFDRLSGCPSAANICVACNSKLNALNVMYPSTPLHIYTPLRRLNFRFNVLYDLHIIHVEVIIFYL